MARKSKCIPNRHSRRGNGARDYGEAVGARVPPSLLCCRSRTALVGRARSPVFAHQKPDFGAPRGNGGVRRNRLGGVWLSRRPVATISAVMVRRRGGCAAQRSRARQLFLWAGESWRVLAVLSDRAPRQNTPSVSRPEWGRCAHPPPFAPPRMAVSYAACERAGRFGCCDHE